MINYRTVMVIMFALFFPSQVLAVQFESVTINDSLNPDLSINETLSIELSGNTGGNFTFSLPQGARNIGTGARRSSIVDNTVLVNLSCFRCSVEINYAIDDVISRQADGQYIFSRTINLPQSPAQLKYYVLLPQGGSFHTGQSLDPSVVPSATSIGTNGKNIIVSWADANPELPQRYYVRYVMQELGTSTIRQELSEGIVWVLIGSAFGIGFILASAIILFKKPKRQIPVVHKTLLSPDERAVVKLIRENKHTIHQREIVAKLGWSKSKVSAVVTNLLYKEIISKEKLGRNYKVTLIKDFGGD